ncbi:hypothetical protein ACOALZ_00735 [Nocardiopsis algeriensis]|uniref:hypothetical protein n=1 Tax=Nocardiopsis algeriensis TaxID=1478215 RepID=UPI003B4334B9
MGLRLVNGDPGEELVVDTGPLSHLAEAGWLGVLRSVAGARKVVVPDAVEYELRRGESTRPHLQQVLGTEWISRSALDTPSENAAFAHFSAFLVSGGRNIGEAAVLAYAQVHGATAVIDDGAARRAAKEAKVRYTGTLGLLCEAVRAGFLTLAMVSSVADHLMETEYRLPFGPGEFEKWAQENGAV